jgi:AAA domain
MLDYGTDYPDPLADEGRRSWQPVDLGPVLDGTYRPPMPTVGEREDGVGLFYPGRKHTVASESEAGKTWFALHSAVVELDRGNAVVYVDFEDDEGGVAGRLLALQVRPEAIRDRFAYISPEDPVHDVVNRADLAQALGDLRPTFAAIDGVTEGMTLHGLDPLSNKDAATFGRMLPGWIAAQGPAVASLDHVTKSADGRGRYALGAVHKLNGLDGAAYLLDNRRPFGIGLTGRSTVKLAKDRPGQLRRHGLPSSGGMHWFGDLVLDSQHETFMVATVESPAERPDDFRPTHNMAKVAKILADASEPLTVNGVTDRVGGKAVTTRQALAFLVDDGYVHRVDGPRGSKLHRLVKAYGEVSP